MGKRPKTQQHGAMLSKVVKAAERGSDSGSDHCSWCPEWAAREARRKTSATSFFADSDDSSEDDGDVIVDAANPEDELKAYLDVP